MPLPAKIAQAILDTIISRLALLFLAGAGGNMAAAHDAAIQMLDGHKAETADELALAAEIVSLQLHTLESLGDAANPDLSVNKVLRLRGNAVSLSRESHKARRRLEQLQQARRAAITAQPAKGEAPQPTPAPSPVAKAAVEKAINEVEAARQAIQAAKQTGGANRVDVYQKPQSTDRIAESLKTHPQPNPAAYADPARFNGRATASA